MTAETALLLPVLLGIGYALALVVLLAADQIRCADAAWEAARALARGVPSAQLPGIAARYAPSGARASSWSAGGSLTVEIERDQDIATRFLPSIRIAATATVPCEPRIPSCQSAPIDTAIPVTATADVVIPVVATAATTSAATAAADATAIVTNTYTYAYAYARSPNA